MLYSGVPHLRFFPAGERKLSGCFHDSLRTVKGDVLRVQ